MSDTAFAAPGRRINSDDLPPLNLSRRALREALEELVPQHYVAWSRLLLDLQKYGQLPVGLGARAAICKVSIRSFARMEPLLARHMDIEADGRWTHSDVLASRGDLPVRPAMELDDDDRHQVSPHVRAVRQMAQRKSVESRKLKLVTSDGESRGSAADDLANEVAKLGETDSKTGLQNASAFAEEVAVDSSADSHGSFVSSSQQGFAKTDEQTDRTRAGESEGFVNSSKTAAGFANEFCKTAEVTPDRSLAEVDESALIAALRLAAPKIPAQLFNSADLAPIVTLIAEGCELERDVVPAVASFVATIKDPLRGFGAGPIRLKAQASRDAALQARVVTKTAIQKLAAFVADGSPPWRAWLRAKGVRSHFVIQKGDDLSQRGNWFASTWPPGWDEARLSQAEQDIVRR